MRSNHFAEYAASVYENGYSICAVVPGHKHTSRILPRDEFCWSRPDLERLENVVRSHGDHGLGLPTGRYVAVFDFDTECEKLNKRLLKIVEDACGQTPLLRQGQWPKFSAVYGTYEPVLSIRLPRLDVLGLMAQCVAYGVHPKTNEEYRWLRGHAPHTFPLDQLPKIGNRETLAFMRMIAREMFGERFQDLELKIDDNFLPLLMSSRGTLLRQFARRIIGGKKYARKIAQQSIYGNIKSGCWGLTFAPKVRGSIHWAPPSDINGWGQPCA
ncbi:MAG: bifunctional DNA primase/polymerase [Pseudomonadota bacterium]